MNTFQLRSEDGGSPAATLDQLFADQVRTRPAAIAVRRRGLALTYRQFAERTAVVGAALGEAGVAGRDDLVVLVADRTEHVLVAMIAVLGHGAAYVPIDPREPDDRMAYVLRDTGTKAVFCDERHVTRLRGLVPAGVSIISVAGAADNSGAGPGYTSATRPSDVAYACYTSGTTGRPKGVLVEHRNVVNYVANVRDHVGLGPGTVCGFSTPLSFDLTVTTTLACLLLGGTVAVYDDAVEDLDAYRRFLVDEEVTFIKLTPSYFGLVAEHLGETAIRTVLLGGAKLSGNVLRRIRVPDDRALAVYDEYGPTEATVGATLSRVFPIPPGELTIGRTYDNCSGHVLDADGHPVPVGMTGELFIGGAGVARGYLNQPDATADGFVTRMTDDGRHRLYRTGDLVRVLADGNLQFVGRHDTQVKIRGFRVELGEIEFVLERHGDVEEAVVLAIRDTDGEVGRLVACVRPGEFGCSAAELDVHVSRLLAPHMCPSEYVFVATIPLTANGKVDHAALHELVPKPDKAIVPPRNALESTVHALWAAMLDSDGHEFGVTEAFFRLGGDSIVAIQMLSRLRRAVGVHMPVNEFLERDTIERLCDYLAPRLAAERQVASVRVDDEPSSGVVPLLPIQQWFFDNDFATPDHWNQAFLIRTPPLDGERLRTAVRELGRHHDVFRLRWRPDTAGGVEQYYDESFEPTELVTATWSDADTVQNLLTSWQSDFALAAGPTYRVGYVHGHPDGGGRVLVACHHLAVDAVSWRVLTEDLAELYQTGGLRVRSNSYRQWTRAVAAYSNPGEEEYWRAVMADFARTGDDPVSRLVATEDTRTVAAFALDRDVTTRLLKDCNHAFGTQINDILLTAFTHALADVTGRPTNHIILEGHGREQIDPTLDVTRTVGWFTTMFPVRLTTGATMLASLRHTKEMLRAIPAKGIGYGALFGYGIDDLPRINFNYLGQFGANEQGQRPDGWRITAERAGTQVHQDNLDHNVVTINGQVIDGRLRFTFVTKFAQATADLLASRNREFLLDLVTELTSIGRTCLTPSDVDGVVSESYLAELQADREVVDVHLANSLQEGFIYHAVTQGRADDAYIVQMVWSYRTAIDPDGLRTAWLTAQRRFATLRLRFGWQAGLVQIVDAEGTLDWRHVDLTDLPATERERELSRIRAADRAEPYELEAGSLFRIYLLKYAPDHHVCLFSHHHSILDGWSITVLLDTVHDTYLAEAGGQPTATPQSDRSYAATQRYLRAHRDDSIEFWRDQLADVDRSTDLRGLFGADARASGVLLNEVRQVARTHRVEFRIAGRRLELLHAARRAHGLTSNALFSYLWHKLLHLYTGADRTISGVVLSGRDLPVPDIESAVGLLINTVPLPVRHDDGETVVDGIRTLQRYISELTAHSAVHLAELHKGSDRLFDTLFIYENWPRPDPDGWQSVLRHVPEGEYEKLDYPLAAVVAEHPNWIDFRLHYAEEIFDSTAMTTMLQVAEHLFDELLAKLDQHWSAVEYLDAAGRHDVWSLLNPAPADPGDSTPGVFHERFAAQARRTPNATAVVFEGTSLTYRELDEQADRLADLLVDQHRVRPGDLVAVALGRSAELIVALLAVMKAGAAYVPVDLAYPDDRIAYILSDTAAPVVITMAGHRDRLVDVAARAATASIVALDDADVRVGIGDGARVASTAADLAYVLYTSGTTGRPKGVMVEHRSFCQVLDAVVDRHLAGRTGLSTVSMTNHVFDIFGLEYGLPLLTGGSIELVTGLPESLDCNGLHFVQMTPSVLDLMLDRLTGTDDTLLLVGGESLSPALLDRVLASSIDLVNVYGPTETTIWSSSREYRHGTDRGHHVVSLGAPLAGESLHVLSGTGRQSPVGALGELHIGGAGLARGYLNNPELTAERFPMASPGPNGPMRLYRTGDLVRLLPGGELEYVARRDLQVKIRGHRLEIGEVEAALLACAGVRQCAVAARSLGRQDAMLVGYVVSDEDVDAERLRAELRRTLPAGMLPATFVRLAELPLTTTGKLDRAALPDPAEVARRVPTPPRTTMDGLVLGAIARLLGRPVEGIGIDDDFFELGGNSILSLRLITALARDADMAVDIHHLLVNRTVRAFVDRLDVDSVPSDVRIPPVDGVVAPTSFAQERLWFIEQFEGGTTAYNLPLVLDVDQAVDADALLAGVLDLVRRHDVLHTVIRTGADGTGHQVVVPVDDGRGWLTSTEVPNDAALRAGITALLTQVFDLAADLPVRACLHRVRDTGRRVLTFVFHHIAFDGWSTDVVLRDLAALYRSRIHPDADTPSPPSVRYADYSVWQRNRLSGDRKATLLKFWLDRLSGASDIDFVTDRPRPPQKDYHGANLRVEVDGEVSAALRELAQSMRVSLFSVLLSAHTVALRSFCRQDDIVVGTTAANRDHPQLDQAVGFFVNMLPLRSHLDPRLTVTEHIRRTSTVVIEALRHQELPFEQLVDALDVPRDPARHPVFQVVFGIQSFGGPTTETRSVVRTAPETTELYTSARFDITTMVDESADQLRIDLNYATSLFDVATMRSFAETYVTILRQWALLAAPDADRPEPTISDVTYLDDRTHRRIVLEWGATRGRYESDALLHRLFERQADRLPDNVALVHAGRRRTYRELNESANALAHRLIGRGVRPGHVVVLCLDRGEDMIVAILATLKAGAAYVPVDPAVPDERVAFIVRDTNASTVLAHRRTADRVAACAGEAIDTVVMDGSAPSSVETTNPLVSLESDSPAYVIYTSGTSGRPKGVPQPHRNVVRLFTSSARHFRFDEHDVWTLFHSYAFDFSVWEMWGALLHGGRLVVPTFDETRDPHRYQALCRAEGVTVLNQTPTAFHAFADVATRASDADALPSLRYVILGGEALNVAALAPWFDRYGDQRPVLVNMYGITETTVHVTYLRVDRAMPATGTEIGRVLPDMRAYVLDDAMRPVPVRAIGELFVGGAGVAPGYLNRPRLTGQRFLRNPFVSDPGERLYRTGDLVRWTESGGLEYVGRADLQVKIRGHRIEPGEIEAAIAAFPGVHRCAVVTGRDSGDLLSLRGYYVSDAVDAETLRDHLRTRLPEYMLPATLVRLDMLPLTSNGKLDRAALPEPGRGQRRGGFEATSTPEEIAVRDTMASVLNLDPATIGVRDDFFGLGGNSILSIALAGRLSARLDRELDVATVFRYPAVGDLARHLTTRERRPAEITPAGDDSVRRPLSFAQEGLWFVDRYEQHTEAYNIHHCFEVADDVDLGRLERAIDAVVARHHVLRTLVGLDDDGEPYQRVLDAPAAGRTVTRHTVTDLAELHELIRGASRFRFDLTRDRPFRTTFVEVGRQRTFVLFVVHHMAFDGWSMDLLLSEIACHYMSLSRPGVPDLVIQYGDYAAWQRASMDDARVSELAGRWRSRLAGRQPLVIDPGRTRPARFDYQGANLIFTLGRDVSRAVREYAKQQNVSLFTVLLAGYRITLREVTGRGDLVVGVPVVNRRSDRARHLIGCFVNSVPIDLGADDGVDDTDVAALVRTLSPRVAQAVASEDLPFELLVGALALPRDPSRHPMFQVWFDVNSFGANDVLAGDTVLLRPHSSAREDERVTTHLDLSIIIDDSREQLRGTVTYATSVVDRATAERVMAAYQDTMDRIARDHMREKRS